MTVTDLNVMLRTVHDGVSLNEFLTELTSNGCELISIRMGKPVHGFIAADDHVTFKVTWCCSGRTINSSCHWSNLTTTLMVRNKETPNGYTDQRIN